MSETTQPITIKKYANRRLYNTDSSTYVTLEDLASMVKGGADFVVQDARSGEDITRSVLAQIIFEQEGKGQHLMPISFLRQLIRFYGHNMQGLVPSYLDMSLSSFVREQHRFNQQVAQAFGAPFEAFEDQVRQNIAIMERTFRMFSPFPTTSEGTEAAARPAEKSLAEKGLAEKALAEKGMEEELDALRQQMRDMQRQLDAITALKEERTP